MYETRRIKDVMIEADERREHIEKMVKRICREYNLHVDAINITGIEKIEIVFDALPVLPFYIHLAAEFLVPLNQVSVEHEYLGEGCETCGYGGGNQFTVTVIINGDDL